MAVEIRAYRAGDEQEIVELLSETFVGYPHLDIPCDPVDYWRWMFIDNPIKIKVITLATSNDRIIGCSHDLVQRIKIGESHYLSGQAVGLAVQLNYRKMGIYNKMSSFRVELERTSGIEFFYAISQNPILIKRNKRLNIAFPSQMEVLYRIRDIDSYLRTSNARNAQFKKFSFHFLILFNKLRTSLETFRGFNDDFEVQEVNRFDKDYLGFWDSVKTHYSFLVFRDMDYMNWRYCDPRGGRYKVKVAKAGEQILGYIVLRVNRYEVDNTVGYIVDLLVYPNHLDVALRLIEEGIRYFDIEGVNIIHVRILRNSIFETLLQKKGFFALGSNHFLTIRKESSKKAVDELFRSDKKNMHFYIGDSDHI